MALWCPCFFFFFHLKKKNSGYCCVVRQAGEKSPDCRFTKLRQQQEWKSSDFYWQQFLKSIVFTGFCVNTNATRGNTLHPVKHTSACKINSPHQGIRATICFVCSPRAQTTQRIKGMFAGLQNRGSGNGEQHRVSCLVICKTLELISAWKAGSPRGDFPYKQWKGDSCPSSSFHSFHPVRLFARARIHSSQTWTLFPDWIPLYPTMKCRNCFSNLGRFLKCFRCGVIVNFQMSLQRWYQSLF